jgi:hypothetical protein
MDEQSSLKAISSNLAKLIKNLKNTNKSNNSKLQTYNELYNSSKFKDLVLNQLTTNKGKQSFDEYTSFRQKNKQVKKIGIVDLNKKTKAINYGDLIPYIGNKSEYFNNSIEVRNPMNINPIGVRQYRP